LGKYTTKGSSWKWKFRYEKENEEKIVRACLTAAKRLIQNRGSGAGAGLCLIRMAA
jgi:hypothetical protein